jgi:hypothetical protein
MQPSMAFDLSKPRIDGGVLAFMTAVPFHIRHLEAVPGAMVSSAVEIKESAVFYSHTGPLPVVIPDRAEAWE